MIDFEEERRRYQPRPSADAIVTVERRASPWPTAAAMTLAAILGIGLGLPLAWTLDEARAAIWSPHSE
jgi:hypothetical protein